MPQERLTGQHRVLIIAEPGQRVVQEMRLLFQRIFAGDGKPKFLGTAHVAGKARLDDIDDLPRGCIRFEMQWPRHRHVALRWLSVFGIEIPLAAFGLFAVEQNAGLAPHIAIEKLHPQLLSAVSPRLKLSMVTNETVIWEDCDGHVEPVRPAIEHCLHPPLSRFGYSNCGGPMPFYCAGEFTSKIVAIFCVVQRDVIDTPTLRTQRFGMVAHC